MRHDIDRAPTGAASAPGDSAHGAPPTFTGSAPQRAAQWLDHRAGLNDLKHQALDEPLPAGTGWWFTMGSVLLMLLGLQVATGGVLTAFYVPSPDHAWDSVRHVIDRVQFGSIIRDLHAYGASFIIVAAGAHLLRSFFFGAYTAPRELTWITGVLLLVVIMAFGLTGYLLPWDQRAYWATVVTINIARSAPGLGEFAATVMRGGEHLGAATLSRWFAAHVILMPMALLGLVGVHMMLMRRHRISGPLTPPEDTREHPFFPGHAFKDAVVAGGVFVILLGLAITTDAPLEPIADPADASYIPRPEWYFLWLFQLLKYFPGKLEVLGAHGIPALLLGTMILLPFLDRRPERRWWKRPVATSIACAVLLMIGTLTVLAWRDKPTMSEEARMWTYETHGGAWMVQQAACTSCHVEGGSAEVFATMRPRRDGLWITAHVGDPSAIAPKPAADVDPQPGRAVAAWARAMRSQVPRPHDGTPHAEAIAIVGARCLGCHKLDGQGHGESPNLSRAGRDRDAAWLAGWIADPLAYEYDTDMPGFATVLTKEEIRKVAAYLATRQ